MTESPSRPPRRAERKNAPPDEATFADSVPAAIEANRELQQALATLGHYTGEIDGVYGPATSQAVRAFQAAVGLPADGLAGPQTITRLQELAASTRDLGAGTTVPPAPVMLRSILLVRAGEDDRAERVARELGLLRPDVRCRVILFDAFAGEAVPPGTLVVPCLSSNLDSRVLRDGLPPGVAAGVASGSVRVAPLRLDGIALDKTAFAEFPPLALPGSDAVDDPEAWFRRAAQELLQLLDLPPRGYLPSFSSDGLKGPELLERSQNIEFLASVLAARELETPLAVGLFGDWGSGKSFFMRRLQDRIVAVTEASARAVEGGEDSLYCSHVRHVSFNAWLHSGVDLWPAFAAQVFREVAGLETETPQGKHQASALVEYQEKLRTEQARSERIHELEHQVDDKRDELRALVPAAGNPAGRLVGTLREIGVRLLGLRDGWRDLRAADVLLLLAVGLAVVAFALFDQWTAWLAAGAAAFLSVLRYLDEPRRLRKELRELEQRLSAERQAQVRAGVAAEAEPELLLPEFARREAAEWAQRAQVDVVTLIKTRFDRLSRLIDQGLEARRTAGGAPAATVPIERVVVYIDDLDRCQHDVVVAVLETLKLLLSSPHFVAVVGVDSRWLFRSLEVHFRELLQTDDGARDSAWAATPQNYLEKIFQYSVVLQPISAAGFGKLVEDLLAPRGGAAIGASAAQPPGHAGVPAVDGATPAASGARGDVLPAAGSAAAPAFDLTPDELVVSAEEVEFIKTLAPLFETPRAVKRLANIYRLLRVSAGTERLMSDRGYEPALVLLAISIGFPGVASDVFAELGASNSPTWHEFVTGIARESSPARLKLMRALSARSLQQANRPLDAYVGWIPDVAEFSFHPWQELLPAETTS